MGRLCMLGLDGLSPDLLFVDYWSQMPNFARLANSGRRQRLRSCEPPITVPAWACMMTGHNPGQLGCYGFHDRANRSYSERRLASSLSYMAPPLWTRLSWAQLRCRVLGVPQTYPVKPLLGTMVTGALTPDLALPYAVYPDHKATGLERCAPPYRCDVDDFRALTPEALVASVTALTEGTFAVVDDWLAQDDWDFFMAVDMGADRLQHGLWSLCRAEHPHFVAQHPLASALEDYYRKLDGYVGRAMDKLRPDDVLMVVSDHGAQAMHGGFALNDWLVAEGLLVLKQGWTPAEANTRFEPSAVDWPRTRAWADGGYVGRIYLNVRGREPEGLVDPNAIDAVCARITQGIKALPEHGHGPHRVLRPEALYGETAHIAPDLLVYMGALRLRVLASLGHESLWPTTNDTGFDAANHAHDGVLVMGPCAPSDQAAASLYDIAPSVLRHFGLEVPTSMRGQGFAF